MNNDTSQHESPQCVIVGAGHAAAQLCASLKQSQWPGQITLVGDEPLLPYHRPPLSKAQLDPDAAEPVQLIRTEDFYASQGINLMLGERVDKIDRQAKQIVLKDQALEDKTLDYDTLVICTGSTHRRPPIQGIDHSRVHVLQNAANAQAVRERIPTAKSVVVIGAGFIGLEAASSLRKLGVQVTVLELSDRVLSRVTSPEVSEYFEGLHKGHGVDLRTNIMAQGIEELPDGRLAVNTNDGQSFTADFVVVGAGAVANDGLAKAAGLETQNGIVVNEFNQTADPSIYAVGDCCNQISALYNTRMRLESVQNATDQAKTAALSIVGQPKAHTALPWFWSDQYDVKFQIAGISTGYDRYIVRGQPKPGQSFSVWYIQDQNQAKNQPGPRLLAVDAINDPRAYMVAQKLIPTGRCPDLAMVADTNAEPKAILQSAQ